MYSVQLSSNCNGFVSINFFRGANRFILILAVYIWNSARTYTNKIINIQAFFILFYRLFVRSLLQTKRNNNL